ncbi:MAG: RibD family protein [Caulobacterales bacterium]|jgi:diaminohydroxyphosphoribosylaminopyrimidine deaminase/5-amino-6-(5-phosphoribosylamino)uracil reductase|nr:RibD family protein [Caulobacterales bacterium]MCC6788266.1 RibD family protein [Hyphomonadaceae bacterium]
MNRPRVTLKLATSLDGRIATASGESRWITGEASRAEVQKMRAAHEAVMVGIGAARADDPELLARTEPPPVKQPARVVLDTEFSLEPVGRLFASIDRAAVIVIGASDADGKRRALLEAAGARTLGVGRGPAGIDVEAALTALANAGVASVFAEGGGQVAASLIAANAVDRLEWFRAPIVLGAEGRPAVGALALARLAQAPTWNRVALRELGPDLWESYERA